MAGHGRGVVGAIAGSLLLPVLIPAIYSDAFTKAVLPAQILWLQQWQVWRPVGRRSSQLLWAGWPSHRHISRLELLLVLILLMVMSA